MEMVRLRFVIPVCTLFFILSLTLPSCTHDPVTLEGLDTVCFDTQILPILQTSCGTAACHGGSAEGFSAADHHSVMQSVTPGDPRASKLYKVITKINGENMMPPDLPLTRQQRTLIEVWIAQGAKDTRCNTGGGGGGGGGGNNDSICFVQDILPMILSGCGTTGCHDAATHEEGYILIDYTSIMQEGIVPYDPDESKIVKVITGGGEDIMPPPPRSPFTSTQIAALRKWISDGAQNSNCPEAACDTTGNISFSSQVDPILQANCVGCHNSISASGNVNLNGYNNVKLNALRMSQGIPLLTGVVRKMNGFVEMPPSFSLDECTIRKLELWMEQGMVNN